MSINDCAECSPWRLCPKHYAKYLSKSAERAEERENVREFRMAQQCRAENRKRSRRQNKPLAAAALEGEL